jgi:hypothetical protein
MTHRAPLDEFDPAKLQDGAAFRSPAALPVEFIPA